MSKEFKQAVIIGRFQPIHKGHLALFEEAFKCADKVIVILGSAFIPRTPKNPFTSFDREHMIRKVVGEMSEDAGCEMVFQGVSDYPYDYQKWLGEINEEVKRNASCHVTPDNTVLIGHTKDDSSFYLRNFPKMTYWEVPDVTHIDATTIRESYFGGAQVQQIHGLPEALHCQFRKWRSSKPYAALIHEMVYVNKERVKMENYPYPDSLNVCTGDVVLVCAGHVLMGRRGGYPYNNCLALVGGHKESNETFLDCAIRELFEESNIKVPEKVLRGSIKGEKMFDAPDRDPVVCKPSMAYYITIDLDSRGMLPKITGQDDMASVEWVPLMDIKLRKEEIAFDHYSIISHFTKV